MCRKRGQSASNHFLQGYICQEERAEYSLSRLVGRSKVSPCRHVSTRYLQIDVATCATIEQLRGVE